MSETPLFPDLQEVLSPRLAWMREHKVLTFHSRPDDPDSALWLAAFDEGEWKHKNAADYFCQETGSYGESRIGTGATEDEAIIDLCGRWDVKHWSIQP